MKLVIEETISNVVEVEKKTSELVIAPFDVGAGAVLKSLFEGKGEIAAGSAAGEVDNLPAGTDGQVLTAASGASLGVAWQDPPGGVVQNNIADGRLTLVSGSPVVRADQTGKTEIFYTPFRGNRISLYDGSWERFSFSEISIKVSDSQSGNTVNSSAVITGLSDTSQLVVGMEVSGTGIPAGAKIQSIDSANQVTLDANATADGTGVALAFKVPANKNVSLHAYPNGSNVKLGMEIWSSDIIQPTLALQDGRKVKSGSASWLYLGAARVYGTAGQIDDTLNKVGLVNHYNRLLRKVEKFDSTSHTYGGSPNISRNWNADANQYIGILMDEERELIAVMEARASSTAAASTVSAYDQTNALYLAQSTFVDNWKQIVSNHGYQVSSFKVSWPAGYYKFDIREGVGSAAPTLTADSFHMSVYMEK